MILLFTLCACALPEREEGTGPRLVITETYGADEARSVSLAATLIERDGGSTLDLAAVEIAPMPPGPQPSSKLEAILGEATLRVDAADPWPTSARAVPNEAEPMLSRFQFALALLDSSGPGSTDHVESRIFDPHPSLGITRIVHGPDGVDVRVLSLAPSARGAVVAWGHVRGTRDAHSAVLRGERQILGQAPEAIRIDIQRTQPSP